MALLFKKNLDQKIYLATIRSITTIIQMLLSSWALPTKSLVLELSRSCTLDSPFVPSQVSLIMIHPVFNPLLHCHNINKRIHYEYIKVLFPFSIILKPSFTSPFNTKYGSPHVGFRTLNKYSEIRTLPFSTAHGPSCISPWHLE